MCLHLLLCQITFPTATAYNLRRCTDAKQGWLHFVFNQNNQKWNSYTRSTLCSNILMSFPCLTLSCLNALRWSGSTMTLMYLVSRHLRRQHWNSYTSPNNKICRTDVMCVRKQTPNVAQEVIAGARSLAKRQTNFNSIRRCTHTPCSLRDVIHTRKLIIYFVVVWIKWKQFNFERTAHTHTQIHCGRCTRWVSKSGVRHCRVPESRKQKKRKLYCPHPSARPLTHIQLTVSVVHTFSFVSWTPVSHVLRRIWLKAINTSHIQIQSGAKHFQKILPFYPFAHREVLLSRDLNLYYEIIRFRHRIFCRMKWIILYTCFDRIKSSWDNVAARSTFPTQ